MTWSVPSSAPRQIATYNYCADSCCISQWTRAPMSTTTSDSSIPALYSFHSNNNHSQKKNAKEGHQICTVLRECSRREDGGQDVSVCCYGARATRRDGVRRYTAMRRHEWAGVYLSYWYADWMCCITSRLSLPSSAQQHVMSSIMPDGLVQPPSSSRSVVLTSASHAVSAL